MSTRLLPLMFDEARLLDFAGRHEVFSAANRMAARRDAAAAKPFELIAASLGELARRTARQLDMPWSPG